ncbi:MAG TPA: exonuclease domain-containing protein [Burkholderiales bacterium]|jgi:DNA polymerase-3 subunit epsilon|nr:exonuclease domain-containing protein [Burkholderiales bacterium]
MIDRPLVFLDLETTGASPGSDRITEIGLLEVEHGELQGEWSTLVNPGRAIPFNIQALTGITDAMVAQAPRFGEIAEALFRRLQGRVLVAHNARFDHGFLCAEFRRLGLRYEPDILCTVRLSRRLFPEHPRHNLDSLIERHGLSCENRHRALGDAKVLWAFTREILADPGPERVREAVDELLRKPMLPAALPPGILEDIPEGPGVYVFHAGDESPLYAGRSTNLASRVRAHFSGDSRSQRDRRIAADTARIEWTATAGELGAIFRQAQLIERLSPVFNRKRPAREVPCAWHWDPVDGPVVPEFVDLDDLESAARTPLYGMFRTRRVARNALRDLADAHELCHIAVGLEQGQGPCLGHRLKRCRGACIGAESVLAHAMRMTQALHSLRLPDWPFPGPIGLREHDPASGRSEIHAFDRWRHLGSFADEAELAEGLRARRDGAFDYETWQLLRRCLDDPPVHVEFVPLPHARDAGRLTACRGMQPAPD